MYTEPSHGARINTKLPISSSKYFVLNSMTLHCFTKSGIDRIFRAHRNVSGVSMAWHTNMPRLNVPAERVHQLKGIGTKTTIEEGERPRWKRRERNVKIDSRHVNEKGSEPPVLACLEEWRNLPRAIPPAYPTSEDQAR